MACLIGKKDLHVIAFIEIKFSMKIVRKAEKSIDMMHYDLAINDFWVCDVNFGGNYFALLEGSDVNIVNFQVW